MRYFILTLLDILVSLLVDSWCNSITNTHTTLHTNLCLVENKKRVFFCSVQSKVRGETFQFVLNLLLYMLCITRVTLLLLASLRFTYYFIVNNLIIFYNVVWTVEKKNVFRYIYDDKQKYNKGVVTNTACFNIVFFSMPLSPSNYNMRFFFCRWRDVTSSLFVFFFC